MKKFNKISFFISAKQLDAQFVYDALKFKSSTKLRLKCYLSALLKALMTLKVLASALFAREDPIQL